MTPNTPTPATEIVGGVLVLRQAREVIRNTPPSARAKTPAREGYHGGYIPATPPDHDDYSEESHA